MKHYSVTTRLEPRTIEFRKPLDDPFVRHSVHISLWDLIKAVFRGRLTVTMIIDADNETIFRVMNLDRGVFPKESSHQQRENHGGADT